MRYLGLALYAEGPTDERFLGPLLQRFCESVCTADAIEPVEVSSVLTLSHEKKANDWPREQRVLSCAKAAWPSWNLLFVHADADSDAESARRDRVQPAIDLLSSEWNGDVAGVAVVPVRATEAWAICDGNALREVSGTTFSDEAMGLPGSVHGLERERDPKAILDAAISLTSPSRRPRGRVASPLLAALGQQVSIPRLRQLSAAQRFESELRQALIQIRVLSATARR